MADIQKGELQDNLGNTIYPHTESDVVFCSDGQTVQEKLAKTETALGNANGKSGSLEVDDPNILATTEATHELSQNMGGLKFGYDAASGKYGYWIKEADTDVFVPFSSGIKNLLHYQFGGTSDGGNRFVQLNYDDLSLESNVINSGVSTSEYSFPNYEYTSSRHYGDIVTNTGGEFVVLYNKGNNMTTNTVQKITAEAGETIFSKQTGTENFRVIVVKIG